MPSNYEQRIALAKQTVANLSADEKDFILAYALDSEMFDRAIDEGGRAAELATMSVDSAIVSAIVEE